MNLLKKFQIYIIILPVLLNKDIQAEENYFIPIIPENAISINTKYNTDEQIQSYNELSENKIRIFKSEYENEINIINLNEINDNEKITSNSKLIDEKINTAISVLKTIVTTEPNSISSAQAYFKLAIMSYFSKKISEKEAVNLLKKGIKQINNPKDNMQLYIRMNLFVGELLFLQEKFQNSLKYYSVITNLFPEESLFRLELIRTNIALGDSYYSLFNFTEAFKFYKKAQELCEHDWALREDQLATLLGELNLRLLWTSYRNAEYKKANIYSKQFADNRIRYEKHFSKILINDVIKVGGISLYESSEDIYFNDFAKDKASGDYTKKMILYAFSLYISAGKNELIDRYSTKIQDHFYSSVLFPDFAKFKLQALKSSQDMQRYYDFSYFVIKFIAKNSLWNSRFILDNSQNEIRKKMILDLSLDAATYHYNHGLKTNSKSSFLKSAEAYAARIQELSENDLRGVLYFSYANSLYMAKEFNLGWDAIQECLKHPLENSMLKSAWFLLVKIAREQTNDSATTSSKEYEKYEHAVDGFFALFPLDKQARAELFENAKRDDSLGDISNAKDRYERLLSSAQTEDKYWNKNEKENLCVSLARFYLRNQDKIPNVSESAGGLESYCATSSVSEIITEKAIKLVYETNSNISLFKYQKLKQDGRIKDAAIFIQNWANTYNENPSADSIMMTSIADFALLQDWHHVLKLANSFPNKFLKSPRIPEALYWKARALDSLLQFLNAAENYELSASNSSQFPGLKEKIFSLMRASVIHQQLGNIEKSAEIFEKTALIEKNNHLNLLDITKLEINAAQVYFSLNKYKESSSIYSKISKYNIEDKYLKIQIELDLLSSNLYYNNDLKLFNVNFKKYLSNLLKNNVKNNVILYSMISDLIKKLILYAENSFLNEEKKFIISNDLKILVGLEKYSAFLSEQNTFLKSLPLEKNIITQNLISLGKILSMTADCYINYASSKSNSMVYNNKAAFFHSEARKYLYEALTYNSINVNEKLAIAKLLEKYSSRKMNISLDMDTEFNFNDNSFPKNILEIVSEKLTSSTKLASLTISDDIANLTSTLNPLDIAADALNDLQNGHIEKSIEKCRYLLNRLEKNRTLLLNEDYGISPYKETLLILAMSLIVGGNELEGKSILDKLVMYSDNWSPIYYTLSDYYYKKGAFELAINTAKRGIDLSTNPTKYLYISFAKGTLALKDTVMSRKTIKQALTLFPEDPELTAWQGIIDYAEKNYESACNLIKKAYDIEKSNQLISYHQTMCLLKREDYTSASDVLNVAIANSPSVPQFYYLKGALEYSRSNYFAAQKSWESYLTMVTTGDSKYSLIEFKLSQLGKELEPVPPVNEKLEEVQHSTKGN